LSSETPGAITSITLGTGREHDLDLGNPTFSRQNIEYTVRPFVLGNAMQRVVTVRFQLVFAPVNDAGASYVPTHDPVTVLSNGIDVIVTKNVSSGGGSSRVSVAFEVEEPDEIAVGRNVTFTATVSTKYRLSPKSLVVSKQLYDADGDKDGAAVPITVLSIPGLETDSTSNPISRTYTLKRKDIDAGKVEFFYRLVILGTDLRNADRSLTDLGTDYEEVITEPPHVLGGVTAATPTVTPTVVPTGSVGTIASTSVVTITDVGDYIHVDRHDGGRDFVLSLGYLAPNGGRGFNPRGYIRDGDLARGGQTYAVVRRESDNQVVRMWISPESPERGEVDWDTVNLPPYTVPVGVLSTIPLDETRPVENQLARRFDANTDGRIYVYRNGAWHWIPDIPTFEANGFYWCDVTAADPGFFRRAYIGDALPRSGTEKDPNYPDCHSK